MDNIADTHHPLPAMSIRPLLVGLCLLVALSTAGCAGVALTGLAVGGGVAASHQMGGLAYRTFTAPLPRVRAAVMVALRRMSIPSDNLEKTDLGERIVAHVGDREIEVELESITANTTRMRAVVRKDGGMVVDAATAVEIINQTEVAFGKA